MAENGVKNGALAGGVGLEDPAEDIKTMKLYSNVHRIFDDLKELGYDESSPLKVTDVCRFDQLHYHGTKAVDVMAKQLNVGPSHMVLDIGAGLGGPARYLASGTGCQVTAVELQQDLVDTGTLLNQRCGLADRVQMVCGDFLELDGFTNYDFIISWLTFLHIPNKKELFARCHAALKPGGKMFIEDYCRKGSFTEEERNCLERDIYCQELTTLAEYVDLLEAAGFSCQTEDVTESWRVFVKTRVESHGADKERYERVHGPQVYAEQEHFFKAVNSLFQNPEGHTKGCKIVATKQ